MCQLSLMSLAEAAMERHHGDQEAAYRQMDAGRDRAWPKLIETLVVQQALRTMGEGRVH